ncbi:GDSL-type esterase/lipase family protein [Paenibacillus sp. UMB4589-SE434]|uniref:GDSL-type esterase/lipase family protein n=1 Tax=Paenibacillus sp. UMB4589-SE434 TaxID=3046314 RepID=UPI00254AB8E8|nr:GDSL-type esterase/lipase family protein [Paenibacillus sp. UMB4589-SE434]
MATKMQQPSIASSRIVCLGDSITQGDVANVRRYTTWLGWITNNTVINSGINGNTIQQMLARIDTDVLAHNPGICIVFGGTNDINGGRTIQAMAADIKTITSKLLAVRINPVFCSLLPRNDNVTLMPAIYRYNEWLQLYCLQQGFIYIDIFTEFANSDGSPKDGYLIADKLHPSTVGMRVIADCIAKYIPKSQAYSALAKGDTTTIVPNPLFSSGTDIATGWAKYGNAGNLLVFTRDGGWQGVTKGTGSVQQTGGFQTKLPTSLVENKTYRAEVDIDFTAAIDSQVTSYFQFKNATNAVVGGAVFVLRSPTLSRINGLRITADIIVPAAAVSTEWITYAQSIEVFTLRIANPRITEVL